MGVRRVAAKEGEVPDDLIAMPAAAAARFAGVSQRQLRYWDETHLWVGGCVHCTCNPKF